MKDRRALDELRAHQRKLLTELQAVTVIDVSGSLQVVQPELDAIEAGLEQLKPRLVPS
ncbi:hypothetical protein [Bradyrhizobium sp. I1.7.5]|uniref:hypothetical protein n=1 Tax=Bradyrhizobium sp. I1.7.5 TaxID=3156363 RepID=UPI003396803F